MGLRGPTSTLNCSGCVDTLRLRCVGFVALYCERKTELDSNMDRMNEFQIHDSEICFRLLDTINSTILAVTKGVNKEVCCEKVKCQTLQNNTLNRVGVGWF